MLRFVRLFVYVSVVAVCAASGWCAVADGVFVEAESLEHVGGWVLDQQAIEQMGSGYVLAHGLGVPVEDCEGAVAFPETGRYHLWVRTRDWVATWNAPGAPGKFQVVVDGRAVEIVFGTEGSQWAWQRGGAVEIAKGKVRIGLHDLTGFEGRCDAIFFAKDASFVPPNDEKGLRAFRQKMLGLSDGYEDAGKFDVVVVGGGMAGTCTAISAARLGLEVALIQNRAVLGGNNSSEVRVHLNGEINLPPYPALGDVVRELDSGFRGNAQPANHYDDQKKLKVVRAEERVHLFLNTHVLGVEKEGDKIVAVIGRDLRTSNELRFRGRLFVDCTGDGTVGYLAGADYRMGRESRKETGESLAPQKADKMTMGMSVQWYSVEEEEATSFPDCPWAMEFNEETCQPVLRGDWDWEAGMNRDQVTEAEYIRDHSFRVIYGNWAFMKNHSRQKDKYEKLRLGWVAYIGGKRESRRLMGDMILCQQDIQQDTIFDDAFVTATWTIDLHYPNPQNTKHFPGNEFRSIAEFGKKNPYPVPYRCLYSRNVGNLMMAGRNISVTHVALGTTRVMRTCGMMGELLGMAASLCKKYDCSPRDVYKDHLDELKALATKGVGKFPYKMTRVIGPEWLAKAGVNLARTAKATVSSVLDEKYRSSFINDGQTDIRNNDARWVSKRSMPQWVEFTWDRPVTVNAVRILTGWSQGATMLPRDVIGDFNIACHDGSGWREIAAVTGNHNFDVSAVLPETTASRMRLNITSAGGDTARLWEVELFNIKGLSKTPPP